MKNQQDDNSAFDFTLKALFFFNPQAIPNNPKPSEQDIQDAKLIYYYPHHAHIDEKRIQIGMAEGIFVFFDTFNKTSQNTPDPAYQVINLELQTHIITRLSPDRFLFMTLAHKASQKYYSIPDEYFYPECHHFYLSHSKALHISVAENFLANFQLFYGSNIGCLDQYIPKWVACNARVNNTMNLLHFSCAAFKYAGVDAALFLRLQYLLMLIQQLEPAIEDLVVFYNGYFVYSSLPHKLALVFKEHYYGSGLPWTISEHKMMQKFAQAENSPYAFMNFSNMRNLLKDTNYIPQFLYDKEKHFFSFLERSLLVLLVAKPLQDFGGIFKVSQAISKNVEKLCEKLDSFVELKQDGVRFIYFNGMNLAFKISSQLQMNKISQDNFRQLAQVYEKLNHTPQYVLRQGGVWLVGMKVIDKRVIYILPTTIQLQKLEEEISRISELTFPNLLL